MVCRHLSIDRLTYCLAVIVALCVVCFAPKAHGLEQSTGPDGSNARAVNDPYGINQTGAGIPVALIGSMNVYENHEAFDEVNIYNYDPDLGNTNIYYGWGHDTIMAGIIASSPPTSSTHANDIGVAPGVKIHSARILTDLDIHEALNYLIAEKKCRVALTGFVYSDNPDGQSHWSLLYDYYAHLYNVVFCNPAGNSGNEPNVPGDAYNGITTGGLILNDPANQYVYRKVGNTSSSDFTRDGRRKPDLCAPSQAQNVPTQGSYTAWANTDSYNGTVGATSWAVPHTAGVAALLLRTADDMGIPDANQNEVIKAVMVNSTFPNVDDKAGNSTNPANTANTWHADRGYGRIDALRAYRQLTAGPVTTNVDITQLKGWAFGNLSPQQEHTFTLCAPKNHRLAATLTWNRRIEWIDESQGRPPRKNGKIDDGELHPYLADLDLKIYEPDNVYEPNAIFSEMAFGLNPNDNLEKCDILLDSTAGNYTIKIVNDSYNNEAADYGFAFELLPPLPGDFEPIDYIVDYSDLAELAEEWLLDGLDLKTNLIADDDHIDLKDFAVFSRYWLEKDPAYHQEH